jgi:hypothetical protein
VPEKGNRTLMVSPPGFWLRPLRLTFASRILACAEIPRGNDSHPNLVPGEGIEPSWCRHRGILSPVRLPIPPSRLGMPAIIA